MLLEAFQSYWLKKVFLFATQSLHGLPLLVIVTAISIVFLLLWRLFRFTLLPILHPNEPKELPHWFPSECPIFKRLPILPMNLTSVSVQSLVPLKDNIALHTTDPLFRSYLVVLQRSTKIGGNRHVHRMQMNVNLSSAVTSSTTLGNLSQSN